MKPAQGLGRAVGVWMVLVGALALAGATAGSAASARGAPPPLSPPSASHTGTSLVAHGSVPVVPNRVAEGVSASPAVRSVRPPVDPRSSMPHRSGRRGRPSRPGDLVAVVDADGVSIAWSSSTDVDGSVRAYLVRRDGTRVARVPASVTSWTDRVGDGAAHHYQVRARDDQGRRSRWSRRVMVAAHPVPPQPPPPVPPPPGPASAPSGLRAEVTGSTVVLSWSPASFPGGSVRTYEVERDGRWVGWGWAPMSSWTDTAVDLRVAHTYRVFATDGARRPGPRSAPVTTAPVVAPPAPVPGAPAATLVAVGDIARCGGEHPAVAALLADRPAATFAALGDIAYPDGTAGQFADCYDPWFGRYLGQTRPAPGNHEYQSPAAGPYFDYFGWRAGDRNRGYYGYDLGAWHVVVLNSECWHVGGCGTADPQYRWLRADLDAHPGACLLAYWHRPVLTTEAGGAGAGHMVPFFDLLQARGADVVLGGHHHVYERWARTDSTGRPIPAGIRSFTVGTGGASLRSFGLTQPGLEARGAAYGALELTLRADGYDWRFLRTGGDPLADAGSDTC